MADTTNGVVKIRLKHDGEFAEWVDVVNHASRYVYNRAVSTYLFGGNYLDRVVTDLPNNPKYFRLPGGEDGVVAGCWPPRIDIGTPTGSTRP